MSTATYSLPKMYHLINESQQAIYVVDGLITVGGPVGIHVSSGGLAAKHPALGANGHRFEPRKKSKLFLRLISRLTTSWMVDHVKWRCRLH